MAAPRRRSGPSFAAYALLAVTFLAVAAVGAAADDQGTTCVPSLQRLLSCLDFIEHRADEIPVPCCVQVRTTVARQPCCLMHVMRGDAARLIGPEFDGARAMVNVTAECLGDASVLVAITRNCSGKPLPPLTPEFTFTTAAVPPPPPSSSGATRLQVLSSSTSLLLALLLASIVFYGTFAVQRN
ncbi:hypothetical protein C2845_PM04G06250 [Panicum miliaceum]|uniref:Bifunctional inhibitor/plant lipid transfer protein/seed storage helical domain-containing protein n=1 Tax=Panicum miliaceum TaxID=4540 RepID=A0A3L6QV79_PANMI|nr:hypothetical protein C2845_PM04G06250 [Panicum miliaceum]